MDDKDFIIAILKILFPVGIGSLGTTGLIAFAMLFYPEKVDKWRGLIWGGIENLGLMYKQANKAKIRYSIQGDIGEFANHLGNELPQFAPPGVKIEFVDTVGDKKVFIENGKAIIRLRRDDTNSENTVNACLLYVSQVLLRKSVRYLSPTQRESVELYVGYKMLERQSEEVFDVFVDKWLFPGIEKGNEKVSSYFEKYKKIDQSRFFTPIFLQELVYMGDKVFGKKRDDSVMKEVDGALDFLDVHASRKIGQRMDQLYFNGEVCRFAIMIVGWSRNIDDERYDVYIKHIRERLMPCGVETIYMLGSVKNIEFMRELAQRVEDEFSNPFSKNYEVVLHSPDDELILVTNHLSVLRRRHRERYVG